MEDSVAGQDGRIRVNDHIVEVKKIFIVVWPLNELGARETRDTYVTPL